MGQEKKEIKGHLDVLEFSFRELDEFQVVKEGIHFSFFFLVGVNLEISNLD